MSKISTDVVSKFQIENISELADQLHNAYLKAKVEVAASGSTGTNWLSENASLLLWCGVFVVGCVVAYGIFHYISNHSAIESLAKNTTSVAEDLSTSIKVLSEKTEDHLNLTSQQVVAAENQVNALGEKVSECVTQINLLQTHAKHLEANTNKLGNELFVLFGKLHEHVMALDKCLVKQGETINRLVLSKLNIKSTKTDFPAFTGEGKAVNPDSISKL